MNRNGYNVPFILAWIIVSGFLIILYFGFRDVCKNPSGNVKEIKPEPIRTIVLPIKGKLINATAVYPGEYDFFVKGNG